MCSMPCALHSRLRSTPVPGWDPCVPCAWLGHENGHSADASRQLLPRLWCRMPLRSDCRTKSNEQPWRSAARCRAGWGRTGPKPNAGPHGSGLGQNPASNAGPHGAGLGQNPASWLPGGLPLTGWPVGICQNRCSNQGKDRGKHGTRCEKVQGLNTSLGACQ